MNRKKFPKLLVFLIFFIFLVNYAALKFYLYSAIWYFDMPVHFLGGFWIGLLFTYLFPPKNISAVTVVRILLFVLCVGVGWEVFEIVVNDNTSRNLFNALDTSSDIFFDLCGGTLAVFYFSKRVFRQTMFAEENNVQLG